MFVWPLILVKLPVGTLKLFPCMMFQHSPDEQVPDKLLTQFNKRPEDKPFSYLPNAGMAELQQK